MNKIAAYMRIAACCAMALLTVEAHAQLEGTLFTQPDEREYLDYLRQEFLRTNAVDDFDIEDAAIPEIPEDAAAVEATGPLEYNFGGVMARRDGVRVWLNGQLLGESELPEGFSLVETGRSFSLRVVHEGQTFVLLPGQTVDVTAGTVLENFQRPQPPAETTAAPRAETGVDAALPAVETPDAPVAAAQALPESPGENAASGETLASQDSDIDTDALSAAASRLGDSEVDALFEILENRRLERDTGEESDEESDTEEP
jgi:hypothetical protein